MKEGKLYTPQLSESILPGVTRASVIQLARELLNLDVIEMKLPISMVLTADECFCSGTAAVITPFYQSLIKITKLLLVIIAWTFDSKNL